MFFYAKAFYCGVNFWGSEIEKSAGSTIFIKNILGDVLHYLALKNAHIAIVDIDEARLLESQLVAQKLILSLKVDARITTHLSQREALEATDFVVVYFQIGALNPVQ